jgi:hypothetical protein
MNKFFQFIFILFGLVFVSDMHSVKSKVEKLHSKLDAIAMFLSLDTNADE